MHSTLAAYRLVLLGDHSILDAITLAPAVTYALGVGALYGVLRLARDVARVLAWAVRGVIHGDAPTGASDSSARI